MRRTSWYFATLLLPVVLSLSIASVWAHPATEPAARPEPSWAILHEQLNQRVAEAGASARIIFIGDSITQAWEKEHEGKEVWTKYYAPRGALNLGIGGDQTQHVLWRIQHGNLEGLHPGLAVLLIGTNNIIVGDTVSHTAEGVAAIVRKLREKLPATKVLLLAILPSGEKPNARRGDAFQVNQIIRKLADEQHVFWVDFGDQLIDSAGTIRSELMGDYLHLSPQGYQVWAQAIEDRVSSILGDAPVGRSK